MSAPQIGRRRVIKAHACGACGAELFTARWRDTGVLVHVEKWAARGDLFVVPELVGLRAEGLPHVAKVRGRVTEFKEHACPKARRAPYERPTVKPLGRAFSAAGFDRKRRP